MRSNNLILALSLAAVAAPAQAQDDRGIAIQNARILTMTGAEIPHGTVLVRNGKIEQVGADVASPAGYRIVDAQGGTLMPGCVSAHSHVGLQTARAEPEARPNQFRGRGRRGSRGGSPAASGDNKAAERAIDLLYARQDVFAEMLKAGVTSIGLAPLGRGLAGQGAVIRPQGDSAEAMTVVASAFQAIVPVADTKTKDLLRKAFADGKREVEARKQRAEAAKKAAEDKAAKDAAAKDKAAESKGAEAKPPAEGENAEKPKEGTPPPSEEQPPTREGRGGARGEGAAQGRAAPTPAPPDPADEAIADLLEGKGRAFVSLDSASDVLHFADTLKGTSFPITIVARRHTQEMNQGSLDVVLTQLEQLKATVLLAPDLSTLPNTQQLVNMPARLHAAGIEVGFLIPDGARAVDQVRAQLLEVVRTGLPATVALAGITSVPAKALGLERTVGTIAPGKTANLLLWSADPLDPLAQLRSVWLEGKSVKEEQQ